MKTIYFITGASGVGKTLLVKTLKKKYINKPWSFHHFDSIGVPSVAEMEKEYKSPSGWQEAKSYEWIDRLVHNYHHDKIFIEGQVNLQFIQNGFDKSNFNNYKIILVDCSEKVMQERLALRGQPELFNNDMKNWLKFLRKQAETFKAKVIDTSHMTNDNVLKEFEKAAGI